jgi:hypothetical protein
MSTVKSKKLQVGTDASASNNFTIYQPATPDGTLRVGVGNADSPTEVGQFNANGYKPATAQTFRAYQSANQSITTNTWTKIVYDTESWDISNTYNNSTYRFTPTVGGYYQITIRTFQSVANRMVLGLYKNGSQERVVHDANHGSLSNFNPSGNSLVYLNGTGDYLEAYVYSTNTTINGSGNRTTFEGHLVAQA